VHDLGQAFWEGYFTANGYDKLFTIKSYRPSIVQASMSEHPVEAIISHLFKLPWSFSVVPGDSWVAGRSQ
jgi:hypothetical protein